VKSSNLFAVLSGLLVFSREAAAGDDSPHALLAQLGRVLVEVESSYVEPVDRRRLLVGAIKGMVAELDPHSSYMPPDEYRLFQSDTEGNFGGVGIEVDGRNDQLIVIATIEGGPAEKAGIQAGDRIVRVESEDVQGQTLEKVVKKMRGAPGTKVRVWVKRAGAKDLVRFELVRQIIHVAAIGAKMLNGNIAYVRVKQFQEHTHDELLAAAARLRKEATGAAPSGVLLDLRSNPGGLVDEAAAVADEFLDKGVVFTTRHRGRVTDEVSASGGGAFVGVPVVVLVDEFSASAAELVTGALQDHRRATVVGQATFGKGSVQSILDMPGGSGLKLTTARYYTPAGRAIQAHGIEPDVVVAAPEVGGIPPLRERDLEGALGQENGAAAPSRAARVVDAGAPLVDGGAPPLLGDVRRIPTDPMKAGDPTLRVAYETLRAALTR